MSKIQYPKGLGPDGKKFYKNVLTEFVFSDSHDLERLAQAAYCLDDIAESQKNIAKDGRFFTTKSGIVREHPALKAVRDFRTLFVRIVRELGLDLEPAKNSRPPRQY